MNSRKTAFLVAWLAVAAHADFQKGSQTLAFFGGAGGSSSEYDLRGPEKSPVSGGGPAWGAQYLYYLTNSPSVAIGFDGMSSDNGISRTTDLLTNYDTSARLKSTVVLTMARLAWPKGTWRPYIFGGLGIHHSDLYLSAKPVTGTTWADTHTSESRILTADSATSVALGYGIGMDLFASDHFFMGFELRGTWLGGLKRDLTPQGRSAGLVLDRDPVNQGNILGRIGLRF